MWVTIWTPMWVHIWTHIGVPMWTPVYLHLPFLPVLDSDSVYSRFQPVKNIRNVDVWILLKYKETTCLNLPENTRKQSVSICRNIQGNNTFEPDGKWKETRCFNLPGNAGKQGVSICRKMQGNNVFQTVENTSKQGVTIVRLYQSHTDTDIWIVVTRI